MKTKIMLHDVQKLSDISAAQTITRTTGKQAANFCNNWIFKKKLVLTHKFESFSTNEDCNDDDDDDDADAFDDNNKSDAIICQINIKFMQSRECDNQKLTTSVTQQQQQQQQQQYKIKIGKKCNENRNRCLKNGFSKHVFPEHMMQQQQQQQHEQQQQKRQQQEEQLIKLLFLSKLFNNVLFMFTALLDRMLKTLYIAAPCCQTNKRGGNKRNCCKDISKVNGVFLLLFILIIKLQTTQFVVCLNNDVGEMTASASAVLVNVADDDGVVDIINKVNSVKKFKNNITVMAAFTNKNENDKSDNNVDNNVDKRHKRNSEQGQQQDMKSSSNNDNSNNNKSSTSILGISTALGVDLINNNNNNNNNNSTNNNNKNNNNKNNSYTFITKKSKTKINNATEIVVKASDDDDDDEELHEKKTTQAAAAPATTTTTDAILSDVILDVTAHSTAVAPPSPSPAVATDGGGDVVASKSIINLINRDNILQQHQQQQQATTMTLSSLSSFFPTTFNATNVQYNNNNVTTNSINSNDNNNNTINGKDNNNYNSNNNIRKKNNNYNNSNKNDDDDDDNDNDNVEMMKINNSKCPSCQLREKAKQDNLESIKMHILMRLKLSKLPNITSPIPVPQNILETFYKNYNETQKSNAAWRRRGGATKNPRANRIKAHEINSHQYKTRQHNLPDSPSIEDYRFDNNEHHSNGSSTNDMQSDDPKIYRNSNAFFYEDADIVENYYDEYAQHNNDSNDYDNDDIDIDEFVEDDDEDTYDGLLSHINSVYVFPEATRIRHTRKNEILHFKFDHTYTTISRAIMHLYIRGRDWMREHNASLLEHIKNQDGTFEKHHDIVVTINKAVRRSSHSSNSTHTIKILESRHKIPQGLGQWVDIDVMPLFNNLPENFNTSIDIVIKGLESWMRSFIVTADNSPDKNPLTVHIEIATHVKHRQKRSTSLDCQESDHEVRCCRYPLKVNFTNFGWHFVVAPTSFDAYFCNGQCKVGYLEQYTHTHLASLTTSAAPCCSPNKMSNISLLYFDDNQNLVMSTIPNISVEKCSCS